MRANTERRLRRAVARRAGCDEGGYRLTACAYCGLGVLVDWRGGLPEFRTLRFDDPTTDFTPGESAHLDHIIPECRNGPTSLDNTVVTCPECNRAKGESGLGDPGFLDWLRERRFAVAVRYWPNAMRRRLEVGA